MLWCNMTNSGSLRGAFYGITAASIWGGMYVVSDVVLRTVPPFTLLTLRLMIGAAILAAILLLRQHQLMLPRQDAMRLLGVGLVGFGISLGAQFVGTKLATAINGAVVTSASPAFILREPLNLTIPILKITLLIFRSRRQRQHQQYMGK
jgi:drug/metabolite transporter (DMT)-like permease